MKKFSIFLFFTYGIAFGMDSEQPSPKRVKTSHSSSDKKLLMKDIRKLKKKNDNKEIENKALKSILSLYGDSYVGPGDLYKARDIKIKIEKKIKENNKEIRNIEEYKGKLENNDWFIAKNNGNV